MTEALAGKWVWVWNWRRCDGGDPAKVAARLRTAGCRGALIKAHDGPRWFDQGRPWREIAAALKAEGLAAGGWAYLYGRDPAGEARLVGETVSYGGADLFVLDVEAEFEGQPQAAEELCRRVREQVGPAYPLYYSSFAITRYHRSFPYASFDKHCHGAAPQVYWNAFRWPVGQAVRWTYEDYAALGTPPQRLFPVAGLYSGRGVPYPAPADVAAFAAAAARSGSPGISFWSYEHMNDEMWDAVRAVTTVSKGDSPGREEASMTSLEFQQLSAAHAALAERLSRLETDVAALKTGVAPARRAPARPRTYTVRPGDTLSGIASGLGMGDWRPLYEANRGVIGPDPGLIRPGQVLTVPQ
ncbi:MAG: LysM domain-containing protein [Dehalococcoidia bacterium]|nr:LysM domain-containing protein [Dehalococcoidia bacterium]